MEYGILPLFLIWRVSILLGCSRRAGLHRIAFSSAFCFTNPGLFWNNSPPFLVVLKNLSAFFVFVWGRRCLSSRFFFSPCMHFLGFFYYFSVSVLGFVCENTKWILYRIHCLFIFNFHLATYQYIQIIFSCFFLLKFCLGVLMWFFVFDPSSLLITCSLQMVWFLALFFFSFVSKQKGDSLFFVYSYLLFWYCPC